MEFHISLVNSPNKERVNWSYPLLSPRKAVYQTADTPVIQDDMTVMWRRYDGTSDGYVVQMAPNN